MSLSITLVSPTLERSAIELFALFASIFSGKANSAPNSCRRGVPDNRGFALQAVTAMPLELAKDCQNAEMQLAHAEFVALSAIAGGQKR
jgi:hypothetical protein